MISYLQDRKVETALGLAVQDLGVDCGKRITTKSASDSLFFTPDSEDSGPAAEPPYGIPDGDVRISIVQRK